MASKTPSKKQATEPEKKKSGKSAEENLRNVKHKIVVMSGKGGVGKSTIAVNLAMALAIRGKAVGLLDADIHGPSVPKMLGIQEVPLTATPEGRMLPVNVPPNLKIISMAFLLQSKDSPIIWRGPVKMGALRQFLEEVDWGDLDYLIVDLPPGTGDEPLSIAQLIPSPDGSIIVTTPQDVALLSVRKSISFSKVVGLKVLGIIENMAELRCPHCGQTIKIFGDSGVQKAATDFGLDFLGSISLDPAISSSGDKGMPFVAENTKKDINDAFEKIVDKIIKNVEDGKK
ncbi:MAG TPA: ATP-binding protein [Euryarchaeota archaeon]|nr:ATP-binding protein [Euryarchaeota archaeon]